MTDDAEYVPPKVWTWNKDSGGRFANINRPIAGPTHDETLPVGKHPFQLYSLATPNGQKVTILFEELLAAGHKGAEYDAWLIRIDGHQFGAKEAQLAAEQVELFEQRLKRLAVVFAKIGNGFEIGSEAAREPHHPALRWHSRSSRRLD